MCWSVLVCHILPQLHGQVAALCSSSYVTNSQQYINKYLKCLFAAKWLSMQVVRVYYATPQVDTLLESIKICKL